jgi:hypothetical protein
MSDDAKDTYFSRAQADADLEAQGRFKREVSAEVIAKDALIKYPEQPASSPFACDPVGPEKPLGYDINAAPEIGGPVEIVGPPVETTSAHVPRRRV